MIARPAFDADYWVVVELATGRIMAQGRPELCKLIAAGRRVIVPQGELL